ncbi:hypothetical protein POVWA2_004030 [Plasmodium ovale wallikeri]|uniref:Uncharacterized protein n=1 Tax=Plasmodium ovale wallikeri TaxID=864142 RepID=A0A1A8YIN2_PLAOA|nr:hypothetical protein POVWA1_003890 [Plasmodium ovale wallikeri]SBT31409.1 hypothetical protein POVWA2_004030 [Plasmodium ovale wallikeri]
MKERAYELANICISTHATLFTGNTIKRIPFAKYVTRFERGSSFEKLNFLMRLAHVHGSLPGESAKKLPYCNKVLHRCSPSVSPDMHKIGVDVAGSRHPVLLS